MGDGKTGLQLRSLLKKSGELELSLVNVPTPEPADDEVVVTYDGTPSATASTRVMPSGSSSRSRRS